MTNEHLYSQAELDVIVARRLAEQSDHQWTEKVNGMLSEVSARLDQSNHWKQEFTEALQGMREDLNVLTARRLQWAGIRTRLGWMATAAFISGVAFYVFHLPDLWHP